MQEQPPEYCHVLLQDHGPNDGGWGTAAVAFPWSRQLMPCVYCGTDPEMLDALEMVAREAASTSGKPTRLAKFTLREDLLVINE